jgi:calmodulin
MFQFEDRFTDIELEKFKQAFIFFDRDGDGTMNVTDVSLAMRAMGALVTEKEVKSLLKKYDPDNTGTIDVNDFIACMAEVLHKDDSEQEIRNAFSVFDKDDTGMLPIQEMRHVFTRIGDNLTPEEVTNFVNILDTHNDGFIRLQDVVNLFLPQTHKDVYAKSVDVGNGAERSNQSYGAP